MTNTIVNEVELSCDKEVQVLKGKHKKKKVHEPDVTFVIITSMLFSSENHVLP